MPLSIPLEHPRSRGLAPASAEAAQERTQAVAEVPTGSRASRFWRVTLAFSDAGLERRYQLALGRDGLIGYRLSCAFGALLWLVASQVVPVSATADPALPLLVGLMGASINVAGLLVSPWARTVNLQNGFATPIAIANGAGALMLAAALGVTEAYAASALILIGIFFFVARVRFVFAAVRVAALLAGFALTASLEPDPGSLALDAFMLVAALGGVLLALYRMELTSRRLFRNDLTIAAQTQALARENAESERLLLNILPAPIAHRLRAGAAGIADEIPDATVLFADLVGFTPLAHGLLASQVVTHLDELFSRFDELAARAGIEKIKTIGDAYMAVGGIPEPIADHPRLVVELGLRMIETVERYAVESGLPLVLRVGVHTGPVVAGVIGTHKFSYDLWGDTVNIASRLESVGEPGAVHVSETTWRRLDGAIAGSPCGPVALKGVGAFETWLVRGSLAMPAAA